MKKGRAFSKQHQPSSSQARPRLASCKPRELFCPVHFCNLMRPSYTHRGLGMPGHPAARSQGSRGRPRASRLHSPSSCLQWTDPDPRDLLLPDGGARLARQPEEAASTSSRLGPRRRPPERARGAWEGARLEAGPPGSPDARLENRTGARPRGRAVGAGPWGGAVGDGAETR